MINKYNIICEHNRVCNAVQNRTACDTQSVKINVTIGNNVLYNTILLSICVLVFSLVRVYNTMPFGVAMMLYCLYRRHASIVAIMYAIAVLYGMQYTTVVYTSVTAAVGAACSMVVVVSSCIAKECDVDVSKIIKCVASIVVLALSTLDLYYQYAMPIQMLLNLVVIGIACYVFHCCYLVFSVKYVGMFAQTSLVVVVCIFVMGVMQLKSTYVIWMVVLVVAFLLSISCFNILNTLLRQSQLDCAHVHESRLTPVQLPQQNVVNTKQSCDTVYILEYCIASLAKDAISGDTCQVLYKDSNAYLVLSDGMGNGPSANSASCDTVQLMTDLLQHGYDIQQALSYVNKLMLSDNDMYATLDIVDINLNTGKVQISKNGTPTTILYSNRNPNIVMSCNLPMGIIAEYTPILDTMIMQSGDTIVLMSDGIFDKLQLSNLQSVLNVPSITLQDIANIVYKDILAMTDSFDDMTLLLARLKSNSHNDC